MKKATTILHSMKIRQPSATGVLKRLLRFAIPSAIALSVASFTCICLSMETAGAIMAAAALLCVWADDLKQGKQ